MASVGGLLLVTTIDVANVEVKVTYDINWSTYDRASDQPYRESVRLIGDDTGIVPAEDGVDDVIPGGIISPVFFPVTVSSAGAATTHRSFVRTIPKASLNEDAVGLDEIRAVVELTPLSPSVVRTESNQVTLLA